MDLFGNEKMPLDNLAFRYGINPFSVIDKTSLKFKKIESKYNFLKLNNGRENTKMSNYKNNSIYAPKNTGTQYISEFSPALVDIFTSWFCIKGGHIFDPFCGGAVRGVVSNFNGLKYTGIDVRQEQIDDNKKITEKLNNINYVCEDSLDYTRKSKLVFDMLLTCPPYGNLETYSDLESDISNKNYEDFICLYKKIIINSLNLLKENSFAVIVLSDFRQKEKGGYFGKINPFVSDTIQIVHENTDCYLYNKGVILSAIGSAGMRADKIFRYRKLTKIHEEFLVFYKGDFMEIKNKFKWLSKANE